MPYEYNADVVRVIDGDTVVLNIDLGFDVKLCDQSVRLLGVDAPESRTSDKIEKTFGLLSKCFVQNFIENCEGKVIVRTYLDDRGKFGRILGEIINPNSKENLNESLIQNGYAVRYFGESKESIEKMHILNRKKLIDEGISKLTYQEAGIS